MIVHGTNNDQEYGLVLNTILEYIIYVYPKVAMKIMIYHLSDF